jgi:hypothetical protein
MSEQKPRLIGEFQKNTEDTIRVYLQYWKGKEYCNIRVWVTPKKGDTSELCATPKGITLSVELLPELIRILEEAQRETEKPEESAKE